MWTRHALQRRLDERIFVLDGAMGTQLYAQGFDYGRPFDLLSTTQPEAVRRVHRSYVDAGAHAVTTNTFGANRFRLERHGAEDRVAELNQAAVALARQEAEARPPHSRPLVAASIGPLGQPLAPVGRLRDEDARDAFREQLEALIAAEPDIVVFETFADLRELRIAASTLAELAPDAAWIAFATFTDEGKTLHGHKPEEVVRTMLELGAAAVGANCSVGPQGMDEILERMQRVAGARILLVPNAGFPQVVGGRYVYMSTPAYFGDWAEEALARGVHGVGGCCGTTPEHIRAMVDRVGNRVPTRAGGETTGPRVRAVREADADDEGEPDLHSGGWQDSAFEQKLSAGEFVVSVELDPPRTVNAERLVQGAVALRQAGVDAINIADSPLATARMSPLALAVLIQREVDIEILLHVSCRDRNVLGLISETMGAHALGVRHLLCVTGDPPSLGDFPGASAVFEVDSIGLLHLLEELNHGRRANGKKTRAKTSFRLSCAVNPTADDLQAEVERFHRKVDAGARYALTQPLFDRSDLERFLELAKPTIPILLGVLPLRNARHAHFIHHEVPGMNIPEAVRETMNAAGEDGPTAGVEISRSFLSEVSSLVQGAYLMPPFNRVEMAIDILAGLDLRQRAA